MEDFDLGFPLRRSMTDEERHAAIGRAKYNLEDLHRAVTEPIYHTLSDAAAELQGLHNQILGPINEVLNPAAKVYEQMARKIKTRIEGKLSAALATGMDYGLTYPPGAPAPPVIVPSGPPHVGPHTPPIGAYPYWVLPPKGYLPCRVLQGSADNVLIADHIAGPFESAQDAFNWMATHPGACGVSGGPRTGPPTMGGGPPGGTACPPGQQPDWCQDCPLPPNNKWSADYARSLNPEIDTVTLCLYNYNTEWVGLLYPGYLSDAELQRGCSLCCNGTPTPAMRVPIDDWFQNVTHADGQYLPWACATAATPPPSEPPPDPCANAQPIYICNWPSQQVQCPQGTHWDDAQQACVPDGPPQCPQGYHWDDQQQQCVPDQPQCDPGYHWDDATQQCVQDQPCPDGQELNPDTGECEIPPPEQPSPQPIQADQGTWCDSGICDTAANTIAGWQGQQLPDLGISGTLADLPLIGESLQQTWDGIVSWIQDALQGLGCVSTAATGPTVARALLGTLERWAGTPLTETQRTLTYWINYACPSIIPGWGDVISLYLGNVIDDKEIICYAKANGYCEDQTWQMATIRRTRPNVGEIAQLDLRGKLGDGEAQQRRREWGVVKPEDEQLYPLLARTLVAPQQVVTWAARHSYDPVLMGMWGLTDEMPDELYPVYQSAGLGYDLGDEYQGANALVGWTPADVAWASHWIYPTLSDAVLMRRRLDPGRDRTGEPEWMAGLEVTDDDVSAVGVVSGYPPYWRDRIRALQTPLFSVRQIQLLQQYGDYDEEKLTALFRKQGYTPGNAATLAAAYQAKHEAQKRAEILKDSRGDIDTAWELGSISDQDYLNFLMQLGLQEDEAAQALKISEIRVGNKRIKEQVSVIHRQVLRGTLSEDEARQLLDQTGIQSSRIDSYISDWKTELYGETRQIGAREALKDTADGLMGLPEFITRLRNLHYRDDDINILVGELSVVIEQRLARLIKEGQAEIAKEENAAKRTLKEMQAAMRAAQAALLRHGSPSKLASWYTEELIGAPEVFDRLRFVGWPDADIERLLQEAVDKAASKGSKKGTKHGTTGNGQTGQTGQTTGG